MIIFPNGHTVLFIGDTAHRDYRKLPYCGIAVADRRESDWTLPSMKRITKINDTWIC